MIDRPSAAAIMRTGPLLPETANSTGVTAFAGRVVTCDPDSFHWEPSDMTICSPETPLASASGEIGSDVPDRGMGGKSTAPLTSPRTRSTMLIDSPPVLATYRLLPSPANAIWCGNC